MFGELSKLFDRNFAVGFFVPVFVWLSATLVLMHKFVYRFDFSGFEQLDYLIWTTVLGISCLIGGIIFLALNRELYRLMEGYGKYNPVRIFGGLEKRRYLSMRNELERLEDEFQVCRNKQEDFPDEPRKRREELTRRLAAEFPEQENLLLPTPFGNALRSFESFPRVMYGLDSVTAWFRLLAVVPKEYIELLDGAKAYVDLWVNLGVVFVFLQVEYVGLVYATGNELNWWVMGMWFVLGVISPLAATSAAREWGEFVRAAFDIYMPRLREALSIEEPANREEEFAQWERYSQALLYRYRSSLPKLKRPRRAPRVYRRFKR